MSDRLSQAPLKEPLRELRQSYFQASVGSAAQSRGSGRLPRAISPKALRRLSEAASPIPRLPRACRKGLCRLRGRQLSERSTKAISRLTKEAPQALYQYRAISRFPWRQRRKHAGPNALQRYFFDGSPGKFAHSDSSYEARQTRGRLTRGRFAFARTKAPHLGPYRLP